MISENQNEIKLLTNEIDDCLKQLNVNEKEIEKYEEKLRELNEKSAVMNSSEKLKVTECEIKFKDEG